MSQSESVDQNLVELFAELKSVLDQLAILNEALHTDVTQCDADAAERILGDVTLLEQRRNLLVERSFTVAEHFSPTRTMKRTFVGLP